MTGTPLASTHVYLAGSTAGASRDETFDLVSGVAGRKVEVRLRFTAGWGYTPSDDY